MKFFLFLILLLNLALNADDKYLMRVAYGTADKNDLGQILTGNPATTDKYLAVVTIDGGYLLKENFFKANGKKYHEILFVYNAEFTNDKDKLIETEMKNAEGKELAEMYDMHNSGAIAFGDGTSPLCA